MTRHVYSWTSLFPDYLRAAGGVLVCGGVLLFAAPASVMLWLFAGCGALFLAFGLQTALRQVTIFELSADGLRVVRPLGAAIKWEDLRGVGLRYFSTRKDRSRGWMQLTLRGGGRTIRIDSRVSGFAALAGAAAEAAAARRLPLTPAARTNLLALGIRVPGDTEPAFPRKAGPR